MKKICLLSILLFPLGGFGLFAQSVVRVTDPTVTAGASPSITFEVGWTTASTSPLHRDTIWLFADYQVLNTDGTTEAWQPATITGVSHSGGTPSYPVALHRGFYLAGDSPGSFSSTVTVTLAAPVNKRFNACVYASDYPPNATLQSGGYVLKGTPPFIINDTIYETTHTFGAGTCITSITDSTGCPGFVINPPIVTGSITSGGDTVCVGGTPSIITGITTYGGGDGHLSYSWYKDDVLISGATDADYTPPPSDAATVGVYTYTRSVADQTCNVSPALSTGSWVLTVRECINQPQGSCTFTQPPVVGTFANFPNNYSAATYVTLTDERDCNNYAVVKIGGRWWMAQNLNYQVDLKYFTRSGLPNVDPGSNPELRGGFWCPADDANDTPLYTCDYWGAQYAWETAMMLDGKGSWMEVSNNYCTGAASTTECRTNHGRSASSGASIGGRGICPPNWHVPTDFEWGVLLDAMEGDGTGTIHQTTTANGSYVGSNAGTRGKAKCSESSSDSNPTWDSGAGTDDFNFRGLPADDRNGNGINEGNRGLVMIFWSSSASNSSDAWRRTFRNTTALVSRQANSRSVGYSIRCVRNQ